MNDKEWHFRLESNPQRLARNLNKGEFDQGKKLIKKGEAEQFDSNALIPVEVKAGNKHSSYISREKKLHIFSGDAVLIHGNIVHKSEQSMTNRIRTIFDHIYFASDRSPISRQIVAVHFLEMNNATYSEENW